MGEMTSGESDDRWDNSEVVWRYRQRRARSVSVRTMNTDIYVVDFISRISFLTRARRGRN